MTRAVPEASWRRFAVAFVAVAVLVGACVLVFGRVPAMARCRPAAMPDSFLTDCNGVGDYEHAAYALGLEPRALDALARAKVVFLGNSRAQFAFSTRAVAERFTEPAAPAYRIGFGYGEASTFAKGVLARAGAKPKVAVVNADPFFSTKLSAPALRIRDDSFRARIGALRIKLAQSLREAACARLSLAFLCRGHAGAIYRSPADGAWLWQGSYTTRQRATEVAADPGSPLDMAADTLAQARAFLAETGLAPRCLVLTSVPNSKLDAEAVAAALAEALGARLLIPRVPGLRTLDGSHLDAESAERWSGAFLAGLEPVLRACL